MCFLFRKVENPRAPWLVELRLMLKSNVASKLTGVVVMEKVYAILLK